MSLVALSELLGATVRDASGTARGRVREIAIAPQDHPTRVAYLIVRTADGERAAPGRRAQVVRAPPSAPTRDSATWERTSPSDGVLLLKRDLLDQQIIDVHGRKVVRVNDVELDSTPVNSHVVAERRRRSTSARAAPSAGSRKGIVPVVHAARAAREDSAARHPVAVRRSARDRPGAPRQAEDRLRRARRSCTRPTSPTSSRICRPPSAKRCSRRSTRRSPPRRSRKSIRKVQVSIVESLDSNRAADIVEEMDPDAAADLLGDLPEDRSGEILKEMEPEERQEVTQLLEFGEHTAAGRMTTEFIAVRGHGRRGRCDRGAASGSRAAAKRSRRSISPAPARS